MKKVASKIGIIALSMVFMLTGTFCTKKAPTVPVIPPATGGGTTVALPDTSLPAPGPKVKWLFLETHASVAAGTFKFFNNNSGRMLNALNGTASTVNQNAQNGSDNQKWTLSLNTNGTYKIKNVLSNKVLSAKNCAGNIDSVIAITETGVACEQWDFESIESISYKIKNVGSGKYLAIDNSALTNEALAVLVSYTNVDAQKWQLRNIPAMALQDAYNRITVSMDKAVARYNKFGNFDKVLTVVYEPTVPTADANFNGRIRFGSGAQYHGESTALHEMAHTMGVGTNMKWSAPLIAGNSFVGAKTLLWIKYFDGPNGVINTDTQHFWPYGLNQASEFNETAADRHVRIVWAMKQDGL